ncbi:MAG: YceI family protein [Verrucomicrobiota bacterium]
MKKLIASALVILFSFSAQSETWEASAGMSYVWFKVKHFGVSNAYGRFNDFSGSFSGDPKDASTFSFEFEVKAESIDTGIEKRDAHLIGPDFFSAKEHPTISFKSSSVEAADNGKFLLKGDITLLGKTKPIEAAFEYFGEGTGVKGTPVAGGEAVFTVKRSDFGMDYGVPGIGDEVTITVSLQGAKK